MTSTTTSIEQVGTGLDAGGPDVFLFGVSKAASTWIHRCLQEHPGVFVPESDSLRFFDLHYHEGLASYESHFRAAAPGQLKVDASPTYLRSPVAAARVARHYPNARFVVSLRHPIDRAFSQYWHEKKMGRFDYSFEEAIEHFMLFPWFVEHGFYASHLENLLRHFSRDRVTIVFYDDLVADPRGFLDQVLTGMGLDTGFEPSVLSRRVNEAGAKRNAALRAARGLGSTAALRPVRNAVKKLTGNKNLLQAFGAVVSNREEYDQGVSPAAREKLSAIFAPEIEALERMTGRDLSAWRRGAAESGPDARG